MKLLLLLTTSFFSLSSLATGLGAEAICSGTITLPGGGVEVVEVNSFVNLNNYCIEDPNNFDKDVVFTLNSQGDAPHMGHVVTAKLNIVNNEVTMVSTEASGTMTLSYNYTAQNAKLEIHPTGGNLETINLICNMIQYQMDCD